MVSLKETHTPTGYNTIADIPFTVSCDHTVSSSDTLTEGKLTVTGGNFQASTLGGKLTFTKSDLKHEKTVASGTVAGAIENNQGSELPSTGGIGTTIFYVVGGILVLAAVILLVTKRRMSNEE